MAQEGTLKKNLSPLNIVALALGAIIGSGCFLLPGDMFLKTAGPLGTALGLLVGAIMMGVIAYNYGYMVNKYPVAGGEFAFTFKSLERNHAFICGWFLTLSYLSVVPFNATALGMISRYLFPGVVQKGYLYTVVGSEVFIGEVLLASLVLTIFAITNIKGVKMAGLVQTIITFGLVGSVTLLSIATIINNEVSMSNLLPLFPSNVAPITGVLAIIAITPFLFVGFDSIPQAAEEYDFSPKMTFKLMITAIGFGFMMYVAVNTITAIIYPWEEFISSQPLWATGTAIEYLLGTFGILLLGISLFTAIIAGINGFYVAASRLLYAMGRAMALPSWFGKLHPKYNTPANAIIFTAIISLIAPWFGREVLGWIVDMSATGAAIGFLYTSISSYKIAKKHNEFSKNKWIKTTSLLGIIFSTGFLMLLLIPNMPTFLSIQARGSLLIWLLLGIVFYSVISKKYRSLSKHDLEIKIFNKD